MTAVRWRLRRIGMTSAMRGRRTTRSPPTRERTNERRVPTTPLGITCQQKRRAKTGKILPNISKDGKDNGDVGGGDEAEDGAQSTEDELRGDQDLKQSRSKRKTNAKKSSDDLGELRDGDNTVNSSEDSLDWRSDESLDLSHSCVHSNLDLIGDGGQDIDGHINADQGS